MKDVEHLYLNSEAVRSLPVGTNLGRERREVGEEEGMLTFTQTLSKNVTRILEELLMGYDQTERPPSKGDNNNNDNYRVIIISAGPTDVKVSILIRSMGPISDVDMVSVVMS